MVQTKKAKKILAACLENNLFLLAFFCFFIIALASYIKNRVLNKLNGYTDFFEAGLNRFKARDSESIFFILGGSSSINNITPSQWKVIKENISLGINSWFVHPFEPDILMVEGAREKDLGSKLYDWNSTELIKYMARSRSCLVFKDVNSSFLPRKKIASVNPANTFSIAHLPVIGTSNQSINKSLSFLGRIRLLRRMPFFSRVSVVLAMSIGCILGYRKIVLCGIDLNDGRYFWEAKKFKPHPSVQLPPSSGQPSRDVHSTVNPAISPITADRVILSMVRHVLRPSGVEVFVSSDSSILYPELPRFLFNELP